MEEEAEGAYGLTVTYTVPEEVLADLSISRLRWWPVVDLRALLFDGDRTVYACWS